MLSNEASFRTSSNFQSPFKKVTNYSNIIPKPNNYDYSRQKFQPNLSSLFQEKYFNPPFHFGLNFYFSSPQKNFYQAQMHYPNNINPQEINFPYNNNENIPTSVMFKNSLAKSGYRLNQLQTVQSKDNYNKNNNMNNNNYYENYNYYPINNNNNIITNIYPTFTKVTNVQIISDNENISINDNKKEAKEAKKENINNNFKKEVEVKTIIKEENSNVNNNNNTNKKRIFECSETNGININEKKSLRKKRQRKNGKQLEVLTIFYKENKNWTKNQIKEISEKTGLKENKIYKWLWDQKNKEIKTTKFVVNK